MIFNVSQLLREPTGASRRYLIDEPVVLPLEGNPVTRFTGTVEFIRTPNGLLARANLAGDAAATCSRCLQSATIPLDLHIEEEFVPTVDPVTGARLPEPSEPGAFRIDENHHLDFADAVRQAAVLAEPMQVLCRMDCRGLCPECGADRNLEPCRCEEGAVDERWAALRRLDVQ